MVKASPFPGTCRLGPSIAAVCARMKTKRGINPRGSSEST